MTNVTNKLEFIFAFNHAAFHFVIGLFNYCQKHIEEDEEYKEYVDYEVKRAVYFVSTLYCIHVKVPEDDTVEC